MDYVTLSFLIYIEKKGFQLCCGVYIYGATMKGYFLD